MKHRDPEETLRSIESIAKLGVLRIEDRCGTVKVSIDAGNPKVYTLETTAHVYEGGVGAAMRLLNAQVEQDYHRLFPKP